jgi:hypothetical protein
VAVLARLEVDLRERVEADVAPRVDEQRDVDGVAAGERQPLEQLAPRGDLARQRLVDAGELAKKRLSSGRAVSSVTRPPPSGRRVSPTCSGGGRSP